MSDLISADVLASARQRAEQEKQDLQKLDERRKAPYQLAQAGNRVEDLGSDFEWCLRTDTASLKRWVTAMDAYLNLLPSWPNPHVPPSACAGYDRDAWKPAAEIFVAARTNPDQAVAALKELTE